MHALAALVAEVERLRALVAEDRRRGQGLQPNMDGV